MTATIRYVGGPTALLELGGVRLLTDPTLSPPGDFRSTSGALLHKTAGPAVPATDLGRLDAVLLSHDQHPDNLDDAGRALLPDVPTVLTTPEGAARLGGTASGLAPWEHRDLPAEHPVRVTAVPARHGPAGADAVLGTVTGFVLSGTGPPTVYVSGDNASLEAVRAVAERFRVDVAVLFAGAARSGALDNALLTLDAAGAVEAARLLGAARVVPIHLTQWGHLGEGIGEVRAAFDAAGLSDRLLAVTPGDTRELAR